MTMVGLVLGEIEHEEDYREAVAERPESAVCRICSAEYATGNV